MSIELVKHIKPVELNETIIINIINTVDDVNNADSEYYTDTTDGTDQDDCAYLERQWTLWFDSPKFHMNSPDTQNWFAELQKVYTIDTVNTFWGIFNTIYKPDALWIKTEYFLFADDITPEWISEINLHGGRLCITLPKSINGINTINTINTIWETLLLLIIGETLPNADLINGVAIRIEKEYYTLSVWVRDFDLSDYDKHTDLFDELRFQLETEAKCDTSSAVFYPHKFLLD